jgi:hypothetical protein
MRWSSHDYIAKLLTAQAHIACELYDEAIGYYSEAAAIECDARNHMMWQYDQVSVKNKEKGKRLAMAITQQFPEYEGKFSDDNN